MKSLSAAFAWVLQRSQLLREQCLSMVGGSIHCEGKWQALFQCGAHAGCSSKYSLCHFDLRDNCSTILPPCPANALSGSSRKAQVRLWTWPMSPVWPHGTQAPGSYLVMLTELDLNKETSLSWKNIVFRTWPANFYRLVNFGRLCHNIYH